MIPCPDTYIGWHCKACGFQHLARWEYEKLCCAVGMYTSKEPQDKKEASNG